MAHLWVIPWRRYQRGGFSYVPPRVHPSLHRALEAPLAGGRLLLAGEHTSEDHAGTVDGALASCSLPPRLTYLLPSSLLTQVHGALVAGRQAAAYVRAAARGAGAVEGRRYTEEYRARLDANNYGEEQDGGEEEGDEFGWDRNP